MKTDPMTPFGLALLSYYNGMSEAVILTRREDGVTAPLPASYFFRDKSELSLIETTAIAECKGNVLDIGAGSGIHTLILQSKGIPVTAIDISPELVTLMAQRGVKDVHNVDIFSYRGGPFDTLLMLGHAIGFTGDPDGLDKFLLHARQILRPGGQILLDSMDVSKSTDEKNLAYHETNKKAGRYIGDICFRMEFGGITGPYFHWLHVDAEMLAEHASRSGFVCEILLESENGEYLARLQY